MAVELGHGDELSHREEVITTTDDSDGADAREELRLFERGRLKKYILVFFVVTTVILSAILLYPLSTEKEEHSAELGQLEKIKKLATKNASRMILYTEDIRSPALYRYIDDLVNEDRRFYALASKNAFSYLDVNPKDNIVWQKTFLIDDRLDVKKQLECIANNINQESISPIDVHDVPGMSFVRLRFYRPCNIKADYIGNMLIKTTGIDDEGIDQAAWAQDFTFKDAKQKVIFHIKKVSRAYFYEDGFKHLEIKSLNVSEIDQYILQKDRDIYDIFNQFTQDDLYLRTIKKHDFVHTTNLFGGLLFYTKIFNNEKKRDITSQ